MVLGANGYVFTNKDNKEIVGLTISMTDCILRKTELVKGIVVEDGAFKTTEPARVISRLKELPAPYVLDSTVQGNRVRLMNLYTMEQVNTSYLALQKAAKNKSAALSSALEAAGQEEVKGGDQ